MQSAPQAEAPAELYAANGPQADYIAPVPRSGLAYNGEEQELVTEGTATGGTMKYSLDQSVWSTDLPKAVNAGTYTVYYKAEGDSTHSDSDIGSVEVKIGKMVICWVVTVKDKVYDGTTDAEDGTYTPSVPQNAGEWWVRAAVAETSNYGYDERKAKFVINKATPTVEKLPTAASIVKNSTLSNATLTGGKVVGAGRAEIDGTYDWADGSKVMPSTGAHTEDAVFYPVDSVNYNSVALKVSVSVYGTSSSGTSAAQNKKTFTVSFETDGGSTVAPIKVNSGEKVKEPTAPQKEGYIFGGWYSDRELLAERYDFSSSVAKSITLYAKWNKEQSDDEGLADAMVLIIGEKEALVFGKKVSNDVAPKIVNDRTMLPARFVAENLGAKIEWNEENEVVTVTGKNEKDEVVKIVITIGSKTAQVNGGNIELDSPAFIENDRTYTPIRFISEQLGASVEWLESEQKVIIRKK